MTLTLYSRPGCHLCEEMKAVVQRVVAANVASATHDTNDTQRVNLREVDISGNPELESRYGAELPVLEIDGKKIAKYQVDERALTKALAARQ